MIYVGKNIKFLREKYNFTQEEMGEWINKSSKTISSYENGGAEPNITALAVFCQRFKVSSDNLLFSDLKKIDMSEIVGMVNEDAKEYKKVEKSKAIEEITPPEIEGNKKKEEVRDIISETDKMKMAIRNLQEDMLELKVAVERLKKRKR